MKLSIHTGINNGVGNLPGATKCRIHVPWDWCSPYVPWKSEKYNPAFMPWLKKKVDEANRRGMICQIVMLSTSGARGNPWKMHALNSENGGPIKSERSGVSGLYKNSMAKEIIRELLRQIHINLARNCQIEIFLMWENFAGWNTGGKEWVIEMARYWKVTLLDGCPIGTGSPYYSQIKELSKKAGYCFGYIEAWNYNQVRLRNLASFMSGSFFKLPWQWVGFWPNWKLFYENKLVWLKKSYFKPGDEKKNAIYELKQIYKMIRRKMNPSYHFSNLLDSDYWNRVYGFEIPKKYNTKIHSEIIKGYFVYPPVQQFIDNPKMLDVPGGLKRFKKANMMYLEKIRS